MATPLWLSSRTSFLQRRRTPDAVLRGTVQGHLGMNSSFPHRAAPYGSFLVWPKCLKCTELECRWTAEPTLVAPSPSFIYPPILAERPCVPAADQSRNRQVQWQVLHTTRPSMVRGQEHKALGKALWGKVPAWAFGENRRQGGGAVLCTAEVLNGRKLLWPQPHRQILSRCRRHPGEP